MLRGHSSQRAGTPTISLAIALCLAVSESLFWSDLVVFLSAKVSWHFQRKHPRFFRAVVFTQKVLVVVREPAARDSGLVQIELILKFTLKYRAMAAQ
jgi:hypothetical protein